MLLNSATLAQAHEQLRNATGPVAHLMQAAASEIRFSANLRADGLKERIAWQLERIEMAAGRKISRGTGVLATIGATAPFVGLFGTVWGIMDSFIGISKAHTTNLAVVAPGIAEALLATALGLVAAIPAVMIYNVLARSTTHYRALIGDASAQVMKLVSRDLDRAKLPPSHVACCGVRPSKTMAMRLDHGTDELEEVHGINVTPFIDVMLVLLIIFMVAAPLATVDIAVDLPSSNAEQQQKPDKPVYLTLKPDLTLAIGGDSVARDQLTSALDAATGGNKDDRIFLRADRSVPYGEVMAVMNELRAARYLKVALVGLEIRQAK